MSLITPLFIYPFSLSSPRVPNKMADISPWVAWWPPGEPDQHNIRWSKAQRWLVPSLDLISMTFEMYNISELRVNIGNSILIADLGT